MMRCWTLQVDITQDSTTSTKGTEGSATYDLPCHKNAVIPAIGIAMVPLNIWMAIPSDYFLLLLSRSGLAKKGVTTLAGVIGSDYKGPVVCCTDEDFVPDIESSRSTIWSCNITKKVVKNSR